MPEENTPDEMEVTVESPRLHPALSQAPRTASDQVVKIHADGVDVYYARQSGPHAGFSIDDAREPA